MPTETKVREKATVMATEIDFTPELQWRKNGAEITITIKIGNKSYEETMVDPSSTWYAAFFARAGNQLLMG
jgi:hypothetical protein